MDDDDIEVIRCLDDERAVEDTVVVHGALEVEGEVVPLKQLLNLRLHLSIDSRRERCEHAYDKSAHKRRCTCKQDSLLPKAATPNQSSFSTHCFGEFLSL